MHRLRLENVSKRFGDVQALDGISFAVTPGEFFSIVGPTNAGKSTLVKLIAGLHLPDQGRVWMDGDEVTRLEPGRRRVSLQFQNIALFPTLNGYENIAYPLRIARVAARDIERRVAEVAGIVHVRHLLGRLPRTFSGGEQQRVAIARALALDSRLLMLDEPLTNLDARLRIGLRREFKALHRQSEQTIIYVTHDQAEAMSLSDRIMVLSEGRIEQTGVPEEIYTRPATRFVAEFMGTPPMNILDAEALDGGERLVLPGCPSPIPGRGLGNGVPAALAIGIRPENVTAAPERGEATPVPGEVLWIERLGSRNILDVRLGGQFMRVVTRPDHPVRQPGKGWFGLQREHQLVLDRESGRFIHAAEAN